jgi:hypothetical protein
MHDAEDDDRQEVNSNMAALLWYDVLCSEDVTDDNARTTRTKTTRMLSLGIWQAGINADTMTKG